MIDVLCAIWDGLSNQQTFKVFKGHQLNGVFQARRSEDGRAWLLIHAQTGYSAGVFRTLRIARSCAAELVGTYGEKSWNFTQAKAVRSMDGARAIVEKYESF